MIVETITAILSPDTYVCYNNTLQLMIQSYLKGNVINVRNLMEKYPK